MAMGKALNKKSFHGSMESGSAPDIAMPDYDQTPPISNAVQDPWIEQSSAQNSNPLGAVPNELPEDVVEAMEEEENVDDRQEQPSVPQNNSVKQPKDSFREIREAKERAERERDALMSQMLEMQSRLQQNQPKQQEPEPEVDDFDFDIDPDSLVEGKQIKKLANALKSMKQQIKMQEHQSQEMIITARIKAQYPDFDNVVSKENVEILNERYPEVARTLRDTPDLFNKAATAYAVIKNFGIHKDNVYSNERAKAVINAQKPRPLTSVSPQQGDSPLSKANAFANGMTEELKEQLRKEMYAARKAH